MPIEKLSYKLREKRQISEILCHFLETNDFKIHRQHKLLTKRVDALSCTLLEEKIAPVISETRL